MAVKKNTSIQATGKRKTSVARVSLNKGTGIFRINNEDFDSYVGSDILALKVREPLMISELEGKFDLKISVFGGGVQSQVEAVRQAIARALVEVSGEELRKTFIDYDRSMLITDTRFKEMKKPNSSSARAKRQKSYR
jgi:small subunit ribosomal protein S9